MATLNLSYEDLASVICLAVHLANADGNVTDDEMEAIVKSITDQYNFEGKQDLLKEYLNDGMNMQPMDALKRIAAFGPAEKQWTSNFFVKTTVASASAPFWLAVFFRIWLKHANALHFHFLCFTPLFYPL